MRPAARLRQIRSIRGPLTLFVAALVLVVALLVLWNVVLAVDYQRIRELATRDEQVGGAFHWTFISLGSVLFVTTIVLLSVLGAQLIGEIRASQRVSTFIATFTHELNSPLASIKLFAQTLRAPSLAPEERERFLELLLADVERLRGQINNVLRAAQLESPFGLQLAPEAVDLRELLEEYVASRRMLVERTEGVAATLELVAGPTARVEVDKNMFRQVLDNLLANALKYARAGAVRVQVEVAPAEHGRIAVLVRDDGCGIHQDDLERVFDRFGRASPGKEARRLQGTGLGLWIARQVLEAHRGRAVALSDGEGRGTTIRLELPCAAVVAPAAGVA